ncbi:MAG: N-acetyltransferase [Gammaproteobacteria bacterium]|nr:N-acetyltransferase [Gammaproteobacteria bacterium]
MITIRHFIQHDYAAVDAIYQQGIDMGDATFQTRSPDWNYWNKAKLENCRLVATENNKVIGWAALSAVSNLDVFAGIAEVSIYIADITQGKGVGHQLLSSLINCSEENGFWTLQAGIFPENKTSLGLHQKNGFKVLATREKMGSMHGVWRDVVFLERRSSVVGI